jgi:predicted O-methyltransferase YrrM
MLRLTFDHNGTSHGDLRLQFGSFSRVGDSYYLGLDSGVRPGDESPEKVREVLESLLDQWAERLRSSASEETVYLPFEFADEYTGWLRCRREEEDLLVDVGWSMLPGYAVKASEFHSHPYKVTDFDPIPDAGEQRVSLKELFRDIQVNRADVLDLHPPPVDPTPIFEQYRGSYGSELLAAAVCHFNVFSLLRQEPRDFESLRSALGLQRRPAVVLMTALRAMGLLRIDSQGRLALSALARHHLPPESAYDVGGYIGLSATSPGVLEMVERLRTNRPKDNSSAGTAFVYRDGAASAMENEDLARHFTMALAGRAKNVAPVLGDRVSLNGCRTLLDLGGGTGIYSIALLKRNPNLTATVIDRPEVLRVAEEFRTRYGVEERLDLVSGDMLADDLPKADVILLSNVLHDWDEEDCAKLVMRCSQALKPGGRILVHDVFLHDELDGPLPIALYSAALFTLTEGRAYSVAEYRQWLEAAGLTVTGPTPTLIHCGVLEAFDQRSDGWGLASQVMA